MKAPVLFEVGETILKDASPNFFTGTEKLVNVDSGFTWSVAVVIPDR